MDPIHQPIIDLYKHNEELATLAMYIQSITKLLLDPFSLWLPLIILNNFLKGPMVNYARKFGLSIQNPYKMDSVKTWNFSQTLTALFIVLVLYLALILKILPRHMRDREPYKLKHTLLFYNALQVAYSVYLVFIYLRYMLRHGVITTRCPKGDDLQGVINEIYPYFIAKHLDLLDTVFFVLRKKNNQVTFLHVYHHTAMVSWTWFHLMFYPTDHFVVVGLLNSFVHVLMYAYYGISSLGPEYAKFVWWKKHLTKVQLIQFILVVSDLHYQQKLSPCPIPTLFHYYCMTSIISFFCLFMNFYLNSYKKKREKRELDLVGKESLNTPSIKEIKGR